MKRKKDGMNSFNVEALYNKAQSDKYVTFDQSKFEGTADGFAKEALRSHLQKTPLADLYFSEFNTNALHDAIRYTVYLKSQGKHVISRQSDIDLKALMRATFLQHAKHLPYDIVGQVKDMNAMVLEHAVKGILSEIDMYIHYRSDVINNRVPIDRAANVSSAGTKTLELMRAVPTDAG